MASGTITSLFNNLTATGLSFSNCELVSGGYVKIGNLVIINMRISATNVERNKHITGFPGYSDQNRVSMSCLDYATNKLIPCAVDTNGDLGIYTTETNGYMISGCYITNAS